MKINSTYKQEDNAKDITYPCFKQFDNEAIILFTKKDTGMCIYPGRNYNLIGEYSTNWTEERTEIFHGVITLETT